MKVPKKDCASVATHMLSFMIRGVFNNKEFTICHYPTAGLTGVTLYPIVWGVVKTLECSGFKVRTKACYI